MRRLTIFLPLAFSLLNGGVSHAAVSAGMLVPHRAVYDLELKDASDRSGIKGLKGRMVYEFNGSACEGFTTTFRYVTRIETGEFERLTDQQTTTFESGDGKEFRFLTKNYVDDKLDAETRGSAISGDDGLTVEVSKPEESKFKLGQSFFPTTHLLDMIDRAEKGERLYEAQIFDGTEDADRALTTTVIIGDRNKAATEGPDKEAAKAIDKDGYFPVSVSYFDEKSEGGAEEPTYQIGFKLYENGVTRDLVMDYGDFSMTGKLVDLKLYDKPDCKQ